MPSRYVLLIVPLLWLSLAGCHTTANVATPPANGLPAMSALDIVERVAEHAPQPEALRTRGRIEVSSPEFSGTFSLDLRMRVGDSLFATVSPGFGMDAAHALVTEDSFFVQDRIRNVLYLGENEVLGKYVPGFDRLAAIRDNLLGALYPNPDLDWHLSDDGAYYYLTTPDRAFRLTIDPTRWRVLQLRAFDEGGTLVEDRFFTDFFTVHGVEIPRRMVLSHPTENRALTLTHRDLTLDPGAMSFPFRSRASARRQVVR